MEARDDGEHRGRGKLAIEGGICMGVGECMMCLDTSACMYLCVRWGDGLCVPGGWDDQ